MTTPFIDRLSEAEARTRLNALISGLDSDWAEFDARASRYDLTQRERIVCDRITELKWLLGDE